MGFKENLSQAAKTAKRKLSDNGPRILTYTGILGMTVTIFTAAKATPKAVRALEAKKEEENVEKLPAKTVLKVTWRYYLLSFVTYCISTACLVGSDCKHTAKEVALLATTNFYRATAEEFRDNVADAIGKDKVEQIERESSVKKISKEDSENAIVTPAGIYLCKEEFTGQLFRSSETAIEQALMDFRHKLETDMCASLNTFYSYLNIPPTTIGDILGWQYLSYRDEEPLGLITWTEMVHGEPCYIFQYSIAPTTDFNVFG